MAAAAGRPIYDFHDWSPFQYAPIYAVFFIPFGLISHRPAQLLWFAISMAAALPAMILGAYRLLFGPHFSLRAAMIIVPTVLIVRFLHPNFDHGQINLVVLAMIVWGLAFSCESKPIPAGLLLAASVLIKPLALPVVAYLFFRRRFGVIISMVAFYLALLCLPCLFLGLRPAIEQTVGYFTRVFARVPINRLSHDLLSVYNQAPTAIAVRILSSAKGGLGWMSQARAATLGFAGNLAILGLAIWRAAGNRSENPASDRLGLCAVFCLVPSWEPLAWLEYYLALEVPYAVLVTELSDGKPDRERTRVIYAVLAGTFILNIGTRFIDASLYYGVPYFCSLALLLTLLSSGKFSRSKAQTESAK
ncbi:MAG: glycosyltransferase family 87 protein [Candidatus Binataceae bacterium]